MNKSEQNSLSPKEFKTKIEQGGVLIDVRTPTEFIGGHLDGALNLDSGRPDFAEKLASLDKTKTYLLYCEHGSRSALALHYMLKLGFDVYHLDGGIIAWNERS